MLKFKKRQRQDEGTFKVPDLRKLHLQMLLYRSRQHYNAWAVYGRDRRVILDTGRIKLPPQGIWLKSLRKMGADVDQGGLMAVPEPTLEFLRVEPEVVDSFDFAWSEFNSVCQTYKQYRSEDEAGQCPFCRVHWSGHMMRVLSPKYPEGKLEAGGVTCLCIHLLWDDDVEVIGTI